MKTDIHNMCNMYLIITVVILSICCYHNYEGWNRCYKVKEQLADQIYQIQKRSTHK